MSRSLLPVVFGALAAALLVGAGCSEGRDREGAAAGSDEATDLGGDQRLVAARPAPRSPSAPSASASPSAPSAPASSPSTKSAGASSPAAGLGAPSTTLGRVPAELATARLERVGRFRSPLALEVAPGDTSGRLFVVERGGRILTFTPGKDGQSMFLDLSKQVSRSHDEQGLLGLAFHPKYATKRRLFVNYTNREGDTRVVEYRARANDPDRADPSTAREIFRVAQPYRNHNGGGIEFGPDGKLYIGTGDGGSGGDPLGAGQDPKNLLGKMLRVDVDATSANRPKVERVARGLRNPWRFDFDRKTGDLYIGDVGQNKWEEIDVVSFRDLVGANFGWNRMEGSHCFQPRDCKTAGLRLPAIEFDHSTGCSITGGEVYRGAAFPALRGVYFYADYCTAIVRSFRWVGGKVYQHWDWKPVLDPEFRLSTIASFGHDARGELYLVTLDGPIYKLVPR